jgi:hypothetical protein
MGSGFTISTGGGEQPWQGWTTLVPGPEYTQVTATGTWSDEGYAETPREDSTTRDVTYTTHYEGDLTGSAPTVGWRTPHENDPGSDGGSSATFTGTLEGVGEGTLTTEEVYTSPPGAFLSVSLITGGTGDFAGARGYSRIDQGEYVFEIELPSAPVERTRTVDLTTSWIDDHFVESGPDADGVLTGTGVTNFGGQLSGPAAWMGTRQQAADSNWIGSGDFGFTGTIEGIGTGTLTMRDSWRSTPTGEWVDAMIVTGGTGDFAGAGGWLLLQSPTGGSTGEGFGQIQLP